MSVRDYAITPADLDGMGVIGLSDTPGLSAAQMQKKFEQTAREVIVPHFNNAVEALDTALADRPTAEQVAQAIDAQVQAVGAGDMARSVYDPTHKAVDIFAQASATTSGMVKLTDAPAEEMDATKGFAATPQSVKLAYDRADEAAANATTKLCVVKLWENAAPTSGFAPQTVAVDLSQYSHCAISFCMNSVGVFSGPVIVPVGCTGNFQFGGVVTRNFTVAAQGVTFTASTGASAGNGNCLPQAIYGIKGVQDHE